MRILTSAFRQAACAVLLLAVPALAQTTSEANGTHVPPLAAGGQASAGPDNPVADAARAVFPDHRKNIVAAFTSVPAEKYTTKPMPELMSFGEFAIHIASANIYYCRRLGATAPVPAWAKPTAPKAQLIALLDETFEYCAPVLAQLTDASLGAKAAPLPNGTETGTRAKALLDLIAGLDHHYGQAAAYLRMMGIVPPTAVTAGKGPVTQRRDLKRRVRLGAPLAFDPGTVWASVRSWRGQSRHDERGGTAKSRLLESAPRDQSSREGAVCGLTVTGAFHRLWAMSASRSVRAALSGTGVPAGVRVRVFAVFSFTTATEAG